jgi:hypothetical protein
MFGAKFDPSTNQRADNAGKEAETPCSEAVPQRRTQQTAADFVSA